MARRSFLGIASLLLPGALSFDLRDLSSGHAAPATSAGHIYALSLNGTTNVPNLLAVDLDTYIVRTGPPLEGLETIGQACVVSGDTLFAFGILRLAPDVEELSLVGVNTTSGELRLAVNTSTWLPAGQRVFVESLFLESSGDLLVVARAIGQSGGQFILRADADTGSATLVGAVNLTGGDVAYNSAGGMLWEVVPGVDDDSSGSLSTIALAPMPHAVGVPLPLTAHFSFPQYLPSSDLLVGLSLSADGSGGYARNFTTLDPATGVTTSIAQLGQFYVVLEDGPKALDLDNNRAFFMLASGPFAEFDVVAVDLTTGAIGESVGLCGFIGEGWGWGGEGGEGGEVVRETRCGASLRCSKRVSHSDTLASPRVLPREFRVWQIVSGSRGPESFAFGR